MNIKFLFDYIESQKSICYMDEYPTEFSKGYLDALDDFEEYLKQAIELTKNDKSK